MNGERNQLSSARPEGDERLTSFSHRLRHRIEYEIKKRREPSAVSIESRSFWLAVFALAVTGPIAFAVFANGRPGLSGDGSVGQLASALTALVSAVGFTLAYVTSFKRPDSTWLRKTALARRVLDVSALAFAHAAIAFMLSQAIFFIFQSAFEGLSLDAFSGSAFVGIACAASCYSSALSGARITTYTLSNLLAVFLVTGALTAMITSDDQTWWQINFSVLGASNSGFAAYTFNATLIVSGLVITTLASYMTRDLRHWAELSRNDNVQARPVQWSIVVLGILLCCVGLIPVDVNEPLHNISATGMIVAFTGLVTGIHLWLPGFPRSFFLTSYLLLGAVIFAIVLFWPLDYYNLTGMELATTALVFGWLVLFIRNIAALVSDSKEPQQVQPERVS